ncbi:MAG: AraC family transcriptional regulator [Sporolactobacillus sp.]|jgi:AraC-like DNA-binding protein|nr:AraC family transcriptional regulator [Sporolactobacillus sp.]
MRVVFSHINKDFPVYCETIGYQWQQEPVSRPNGWHYYHWLQTLQGEGIIETSRQKFRLTSGSGILFAPNLPHDYYSAHHDRIWKTAWMTFYGTSINELMTFLAMDEFLYFKQLHRPLEHFIIDTFAVFSDEGADAPFDQSTALYRFIMLLKQNSQSMPPVYQINEIVRPIITFIDKHYSEKITNQTLAALTGYSVTYQTEIFNLYYHVTPLQYLHEYRLRKAKSLLLLHPGLQVQQIGNRVGFNDISKFISRFKAYTGCTPLQFRAQYRQKKMSN